MQQYICQLILYPKENTGMHLTNSLLSDKSFINVMLFRIFNIQTIPINMK